MSNNPHTPPSREESKETKKEPKMATNSREDLRRITDIYGCAVKDASKIKLPELGEDDKEYIQAWQHATMCRQDLDRAIDAYVQAERLKQHEETADLFVYENAAITYKRIDKMRKQLQKGTQDGN